MLVIQKQPGVSTLELTSRLDEILDEIQASLPEGMVIHSHVFRQADFIEVAIRNVATALRDGGILVVIIMLVFLASVRATGITVLAIPLSLVAAVLAMKALDTTINTMTLGGMAIAVGAIVDDAVGIIIGVVIGVLTDNVGLWIALGLVFGTAIGATLERRRSDER